MRQRHESGTHGGDGVLLDLVWIVQVPLSPLFLGLVLGAVLHYLQRLLALDPVHLLLQDVGLAGRGDHRVVQRQLALSLCRQGRFLSFDLGLQRLGVDTDRALFHIEDAVLPRLLGLAAAQHRLRLLDVRWHVVHDDWREVLHR